MVMSAKQEAGGSTPSTRPLAALNWVSGRLSVPLSEAIDPVNGEASRLAQPDAVQGAHAMPLKVLIVGEEDLVRASTEFLLASQYGIVVVGEVGGDLGAFCPVGSTRALDPILRCRPTWVDSPGPLACDLIGSSRYVGL